MASLIRPLFLMALASLSSLLGIYSPNALKISSAIILIAKYEAEAALL